MQNIALEHKIAVLKFSGSLLSKMEEIPQAVHEVYQYLRLGYRVLAIVSSIDNSAKYPGLDSFETEGFIPPAPEFAELLATGETAAACLFTMGLDRAGIKAKKLNHQCLITKNSLLNADPESFTKDLVSSLFERYSVLVLPGAIGYDQTKKTSLLGQKGADYTAIYAAWSLRADKCVIYKEVCDTELKRYESLCYSDLLKLPSPIIHHKAIKFAEAHNVCFSIKSLTNVYKTVVGSAPSTFFSQNETIIPLKVALLGLGTIGFGVYKHLLANQHLFTITGIAVLDLKKHQRDQLPPTLISDNSAEILGRKCDVVIELTGDPVHSEAIIRQALSQGCHAITANRALIAEKGIELCEFATQNQVRLLYSASIGGAIPIIETLQNINNVKTITGVLSSTCNFILDKVTEGQTLNHTLSLTKILGLSESEPTLDLYGINASQKATILCRAAFGRNPDSIDVTGIQCLDETKIREAYAACKNIRLVVNCTFENNIIKANVEPVAIDINHCLAHVTGTQNAVVIETQDNITMELHGTGVGRWPVAESVFSDLLELSNQLNRNQSYINRTGHNYLVESEIKNKSLEEVV